MLEGDSDSIGGSSLKVSGEVNNTLLAVVVRKNTMTHMNSVWLNNCVL